MKNDNVKETKKKHVNEFLSKADIFTKHKTEKPS